MDEILKCGYSQKAIEKLFPVELFIMPYRVVLTFESVDEIPKYDHSNEKLLRNNSYIVLFFIILQKEIPDFNLGVLIARVNFSLISHSRNTVENLEKCKHSK